MRLFQSKMNIQNALLLVLLASLWGPSFLFIKVAVQEIQPLTITMLRIGLAALIMNTYLYVIGQRLTKDLTFWRHVLIAGFFMHSLPFSLINWGEQYVDSGIASILNGLTPLSTVLLANFFIADERMSIQKILGVAAGFGGLVVLALPNLMSGYQATSSGILAVTLGAISYGVGLVYTKRYLKNTRPIHAPAGQLLVAVIYLIPVSFIFESPIIVLNASWKAIGSITLLSVFGTALAFVIYYRLIESASAAYLSMVTYLMPIYGVVLGVLILEESLSTEMMVGMLLILFGIVLINAKRKQNQ